MGVGIGFGLAEFPFSGAQPFWEWIELCEEGGVDSIWQTDRLISPTAYLECMSTMAALAGATNRIKFGMNVACFGWREPVLLAKQCATIDLLSDGRLLPAVGIGSPRGSEWPALGLPAKGRGARIDEALEIMGRLWSEDSVTFEGEYYRLTDARIEPKPVNSRIPLWVGGQSKAAIRRTARFGTGWLGGASTPAGAGHTVAAIKEATAEFGRSIDDDHYGVGFSYRFGNWEEPVVQDTATAYREQLGVDPAERIVIGGASDILARIDEFVAAGVFKFVLRPIGSGNNEILDQTRLFIDEVQPEVWERNRTQR